MYINQQDAQNSVIGLYFPLDALHVSDYISPSSGATFISCTSHLVYSDRRTAYKVAPDDGLIQSETCRASNEKIKFNHKNSVHLVGLYTYCKMMHGAYSVKPSRCAVLYSFLSLRLVLSLCSSQLLLLVCFTHCHYVTACTARFSDCTSNCYFLI